ncbi:MAG: CvpA family protein [Zetaproteobacteria bacterium]|nr:MAG: CvpA family protein [Zetaproteobacteria bacterium]
MNLFDYLLISVVGLSMILSLWRGFVREIISLIGLVAAFLAASRLSGWSGDLLGRWIHNGTLADIAGFVLVFVLVMVAVGLFGALIRRLVDAADLTATDRTLGVLFGLARGCLLVALGFLIFTSYASPEQKWLKGSLLAPYGIAAGDWLGRAIPEGYPFSRRDGAAHARAGGSLLPAASRVPVGDRQALEAIIREQLKR